MMHKQAADEECLCHLVPPRLWRARRPLHQYSPADKDFSELFRNGRLPEDNGTVL